MRYERRGYRERGRSARQQRLNSRAQPVGNVQGAVRLDEADAAHRDEGRREAEAAERRSYCRLPPAQGRQGTALRAHPLRSQPRRGGLRSDQPRRVQRKVHQAHRGRTGRHDLHQGRPCNRQWQARARPLHQSVRRGARVRLPHPRQDSARQLVHAGGQPGRIGRQQVLGASADRVDRRHGNRSGVPSISWGSDMGPPNLAARMRCPCQASVRRRRARPRGRPRSSPPSPGS